MHVASPPGMKQGGRREHKEKERMWREAEGSTEDDLGRVGEEDLSDPTEEIIDTSVSGR